MIVDMQNGFCNPDGSFAKLGFDITMFVGAIEGCAKLVRAAHTCEVPVIYTRYVYQPGYQDGGILTNELFPGMKESNSLAAGSWDADIVDQLAPEDHDLVIDKSRYSAFYGTRLEPILTNKQIKSLVVAGVTTNMCVESTVRDASHRIRVRVGCHDRRRSRWLGRQFLVTFWRLSSEEQEYACSL
jgi:ureidoacrylate peracid hydrolase